MDKRTIDIRNAWIDYYQSLGFEQIPSAPLVHPAFPTTFNMSAGLVQLEPSIVSQEKYKALKQCLVQKCFRHFDMKKVGDPTHLSFFEMPAVFEILDFNLIKVVDQFWTFLTKILNIDPEMIWATSFSQDKMCSKKIRQEKGVNEHLKDLFGQRLVLAKKETNLWIQGGDVRFKDKIRPCGPQIEFFYNLQPRKDRKERPSLNFENGFLEFGTIIVIKHYINEDKLIVGDLVNKSVETVIGLERTLSIIEDTPDNIFQISSFTSLAKKLAVQKISKEVKIILDHIRALTFIWSEEQILPGQDDRTWIVRNLIRNLLNSFYLLKIRPQEYLPALIDEVIGSYSKIYPETKGSGRIVLKLILDQEQIYQRSLKKAKKEIEKYLEENKITWITQKEKELFNDRYGVRPEVLPFLLSNQGKSF